MIVYAESSAVLSWLLGESQQSLVLHQLSGADRVVSSSLTGLKCARGLARAAAASRLSKTGQLAALRLLDTAETAWDVHDMSERIIHAGARPFSS